MEFVNLNYPLKQVLEVKHRRVEQAEKIVKEKIELLKKEQEKLVEREKERNRVFQHHNDKLQQMRDEMDTTTTSFKIQQMKAYLKVVKEKLKVEDKKVKDQKDQVQIAEKNLDLAKQELNRKRQEVDKMQTHRKDWEKITMKELEILEGREHDELGTLSYMMNRRNRIE